MRLPVIGIAAVLALLLSGCTVSSAQPGAEPDAPVPGAEPRATTETFTPVVGRVLAAPEAAPSTDGKVHLAYELLLSNMLSQSIGIDAITVMSSGRALQTVAGDELTPWVRIIGGQSGSRTLGGGQQAIVWMDVTVDRDAEIPADLEHVVDISPTTAVVPLVTTPMTETLAATTVDETDPIVIGPPLAGAGWLDGNSCCAVTPHRAAVNPINGSLHVPERFAIDYVQLNAQGKIFDGPVDQLSSYAYEGADILAVGDGPIVSMEWDLPEQTPGANPSGLAVTEYGGNHIVQDIGGGHYAFYAHLQPGNPEGLRVGQQLTRGEVIAHLGNSGNSDSPHLHFHVMDSPLPLASNGLPFAIDGFDLVGTVSPAAIDACVVRSVACAVDTAGAGSEGRLSPLFGDVMDYPTR